MGAWVLYNTFFPQLSPSASVIRRMLQCYFAVNLQKCFVDSRTSPDLQRHGGEVDKDWIFILGWTVFLKTGQNMLVRPPWECRITATFSEMILCFENLNHAWKIETCIVPSVRWEQLQVLGTTRTSWWQTKVQSEPWENASCLLLLPIMEATNSWLFLTFFGCCFKYKIC